MFVQVDVNNFFLFYNLIMKCRNVDKGGGPAKWIRFSCILRPFQCYFSLLNSIFGSTP